MNLEENRCTPPASSQDRTSRLEVGGGSFYPCDRGKELGMRKDADSGRLARTVAHFRSNHKMPPLARNEFSTSSRGYAEFRRPWRRPAVHAGATALPTRRVLPDAAWLCGIRDWGVMESSVGSLRVAEDPCVSLVESQPEQGNVIPSEAARFLPNVAVAESPSDRDGVSQSGTSAFSPDADLDQAAGEFVNRFSWHRSVPRLFERGECCRGLPVGQPWVERKGGMERRSSPCLWGSVHRRRLLKPSLPVGGV